jgi:transcriptional regulator with PAS, ATPase and Fis domain
VAEKEDTVTVPEEQATGGDAQRIPLLLISGAPGAAGAARTSPAPRMASVARGLVIGRGRSKAEDEAGYLALDDKLLSRKHLRISVLKGGYAVEDAGSTNGTLLDGRRLLKQARLADGGVLFFGAHAAVFRRATTAVLGAIEEEAAEPLGPVGTISPELSLTLAKLRKLAPTRGEILLTGETGVGKEVYARAVHRVSGRPGRFVAINCAALPADLAESELFGYARGAHSTATEAKPGLVEAAHGGTLFLDEIGDMPPRLQAKLLRFLQDGEVMPLGSTASRRVDVRVLAATSELRLAGEGALRADLVARLGAEAIEIPPLRERPEDIAALAAHFGGGALRGMDPAAFRALLLYGWPRNVRELEKAIGRAVALAGEGAVRLEHLPDAVAGAVERAPTVTVRRPARVAPPRGELEDLLRRHHGNVAEVARALDRRWNVVWRWLVKHELEPERFRR